MKGSNYSSLYYYSTTDCYLLLLCYFGDYNVDDAAYTIILLPLF